MKLNEKTKKLILFVGILFIVIASINIPFDGKMTISLPLFLFVILACFTVRV